MKAQIRVFEINEKFPNPNQPIQEFEIEFRDSIDLKKQYQEARQVWGEYQVEAHLDGMKMGESETYAEQIKRELHEV